MRLRRPQLCRSCADSASGRFPSSPANNHDHPPNSVFFFCDPARPPAWTDGFRGHPNAQGAQWLQRAGDQEAHHHQVPRLSLRTAPAAQRAEEGRRNGEVCQGLCSQKKTCQSLGPCPRGRTFFFCFFGASSRVARFCFRTSSPAFCLVEVTCTERFSFLCCAPAKD